MTLTVGSLFAGIGGFDLGFERCGMRTVWQVEQNDFCRAVLARHFPEAQRFVDVCEVGAHNLPPVDLICGGFPCQDISLAGRGAGIDGARSGLWSEFARIIGELGPRYAVVENVPAIRSRGLDRVLRDLAALGYDAEWDCIPASAVGAAHRRDRLWLVAYPARDAGSRSASTTGSERERVRSRCAQSRASASGPCAESLGTWPEPDVGRVADGVPARVDRLSALGNALVPQIAEWIGQRILDYEATGR
jgi:DNA (cytosine-5)-methyltransferase 1